MHFVIYTALMKISPKAKYKKGPTPPSKPDRTQPSGQITSSHPAPSTSAPILSNLPIAHISKMARDTWHTLPPEIQNKIIGLLPILGGRCSQLATVCKAWQSIIEPLNFANISLDMPRLTNPDSQAILFQKRNQIHYIWFRVEIK